MAYRIRSDTYRIRDTLVNWRIRVTELLSIMLLLLAGVVVLSLGCPELDCWYKQIASYILVTAEGFFFSEG